MDLPLCLLLSYPRALAHTLSQLPVFPVPRDLVKKIRDTKGTFHAKMGLIKDRNDMDLTEAQDIKRRGQEYTEELYKKIFMTKIITMVEPDILECEVKSALGSITTNKWR